MESLLLVILTDQNSKARADALEQLIGQSRPVEVLELTGISVLSDDLVIRRRALERLDERGAAAPAITLIRSWREQGSLMNLAAEMNSEQSGRASEIEAAYYLKQPLASALNEVGSQPRLFPTERSQPAATPVDVSATEAASILTAEGRPILDGESKCDICDLVKEDCVVYSAPDFRRVVKRGLLPPKQIRHGWIASARAPRRDVFGNEVVVISTDRSPYTSAVSGTVSAEQDQAWIHKWRKANKRRETDARLCPSCDRRARNFEGSAFFGYIARVTISLTIFLDALLIAGFVFVPLLLQEHRRGLGEPERSIGQIASGLFSSWLFLGLLASMLLLGWSWAIMWAEHRSDDLPPD